MRKSPVLISFVLLVSILALPQAGAASGKLGATCTKAGTTSIVANVKFTCIKSDKKLIWNKGVTVVAKPTPTPTPTKLPTPVQVFYVPKDKTAIYKISDTEGCAVAFDSSGKKVTFATLWALKDGQWLEVQTLVTGWEKTCDDSRLPNNKYFAYAKAAIDDGTQLRWKFVGQVNIKEHDSKGNGYSQPVTFTVPPAPPKPPEPIKPYVPHPVEGGYGITWQNITQRVADISAAAWTDAQLTLIRNKDLPNAGPGLTTYMSPNAARLDNTLLTEVKAILNRTFTLFARVPFSSHIFFVATTFEDAAETKEALKAIYPNSKFIRDSIDSIYSLNQNPLAGTPFTYTGCGDNYYGRNTFTSPPNTREAQAVILGVCPMLPGGIAHFNGVQGMSHEYVHSIQIGLRPNTYDSFANIPCWMVEGEAEWAQTAMATNFSNYLRSQHFHPYLLSSAGRDIENTTAREWKAEEVQSYYVAAADTLTCHDTNQYAYSYSLGAATIEALVSIGGSESFFALHERLISGETMNESFNAVYGLTWDAASPILAEIVAKKITLAWTKEATTYQTRP